MKSKAVYFPGLNTIRFIAAFIVVLSHVELFKKYMGLPNAKNVAVLLLMGRLGVVLFFVLSGFLITYLLLLEKQQFKTIDIKKFYIRRILRIWPLYYLLLILSLFILPYIPGLEVPHCLKTSEITLPIILMCVFFLPNWAISAYPPITFFGQAWSVGVEEQFYLVWPFLIKTFKNVWFMLLSIIAIYLAVRIALFPIIKFKFHYWNDNMQILKLFWDDLLIDTMAIGGLFSYAYFKQHAILKFFYHPFTQIVSYFILLYFFLTGNNIPLVKSEFFAFLFGILILNVATNKKAFSKWFNLPLFDYLGKISYGIYMYHCICIVVTIKLMLKFDLFNNVALYLISIFTSIALAALSYQYMEKYFLSWKNKFAKVQSTNTRVVSE
jgi:peptidoglycan/LPS O-acetylase OafA/YrhL